MNKVIYRPKREEVIQDFRNGIKNFSWVVFWDADLRGLDFSFCDLEHANFKHVDLRGGQSFKLELQIGGFHWYESGGGKLSLWGLPGGPVWGRQSKTSKFSQGQFFKC